jgi:hypothetical protein
LIERLVSYGRSYAVLLGDLKRALELHDEGVRVVVGDPDNIESYRRLRAPDAALVVASSDDYLNTNIACTVRELTERVPIISLARAPESVDILELAGSSHVLQLADMLGRSLARRALGGEARASIIGRFGDLVIASECNLQCHRARRRGDARRGSGRLSPSRGPTAGGQVADRKQHPGNHGLQRRCGRDARRDDDQP